MASARQAYHGGPVSANARKAYHGGPRAAGARTAYHGATKKKGGHHGVLGLVENLGSDVVHAVAGIPMGVVETVHHPGRTVKATAKQYKQTYGPLLHGDVSKFLHNVYEHPLGPALDLATIVTLGSGAAAKVGLLSAEARTLELRSGAQAVGQEAKVATTKLTSRNPAIRARQLAVHRMLNRLPHDFPHFGETLRYEREVGRIPRQEALRRRAAGRKYTQATKHLSGEEFAALHIIMRGVHPEDWLALLRKQGEGKVQPEMLKVLDNPKVRELVDHPNVKIEKAIPAFRELSQLDAELKIKHGVLDRGAAEARPGFHQRLTAYELGPDAARRDLEARLADLDKVYNDLVDKTAAAEHGAPADYADITRRRNMEAKKRARKGLPPLQSVSDELRGLAESRLSKLIEDNPDHPAAKKLADLIDEAHGIREQLNARAEAAIFGEPKRGPTEDFALRPMRHEPAYVPDVSNDYLANAEFNRMSGGLGVPHLPGSTRQNKGVLFKTGQLILHPDVLGTEYLRTIKYGLFDDIHNELMSGAARLPKGQQLPEGWVYIRRPVRSKTGNIRAERIHPVVGAAGERGRRLQELIPDPEKPELEATTIRVEDAAALHDHYLIVPKRLADQMAGEFTRANSVIRNFINKPTAVWRALVLGLRPGFLTNNVVGNHLLYALHLAGPEGLRAYLNAVKREKGASVVRSLLDDKQIPRPLREQFMDEFFPEQGAAGTFGGTQRPRSKAVRAGRTGILGVLPVTQSVAETNLRRAAVEALIRKNPEFKKVWKDMPRQTREFEAAAAKLLRGEGGDAFQREISTKVDNMLGNYTDLSDFERNVLRSTFPFYSWYRAITRIATHLALDTPGRANLLTKIGNIGVAATEAQLGALPEWLQGLVPVGGEHDGQHGVLTTGGFNPFQTLVPLGQGIGGILTGSPGETGKAFSELGPNPIALAALQNMAGKNFFTGRTLTGGGGLPVDVLRQMGMGLPQVQLAQALRGHPAPSKTYGERSARQALLAFLGVPLRELNMQQAQQYANAS